MDQIFSKEILEGGFFNPTKGNLSLEETGREIVAYMEEFPEKFYDVIVGCDSSSEENPNFPIAVVILRKGQGGRFFLKKVNYQQRKFFNWKERILEEVLLSCQIALLMKEKISAWAGSSKAGLKYQFRYIHADVGGNGKTKDMIKEVVGLIKGSGFEPCIKPESFAASNVADRYS
jgi:hypothetical protein